MLIQVITLKYDDGDKIRYVDKVGTENAAKSFHMFEEHVYDDGGMDGTVKIVHVDNFKLSHIVEE